MTANSKQFTIHLLVLILAGLTYPSFAVEISQKLLALHQSVGPVIDADENLRCGLFPADVGLIAAKLYLTSRQRWVLHLLGEQDGQAWMRTVTVSSAVRDQLQARISAVAERGSLSVSSPVYEVKVVANADSGLLSIRLLDRTSIVGWLVRCHIDTVQFVTTNGLRIAIPEDQILAVEVPEGKLIGDTFLRNDPNHTRLLFGPTGRTLKAGEGIFSDFYVFFPSLTLGVTNEVMVGAGVSLVPGSENQVFYVSPKVRVVHGQNFDWAVGLFYLGLPGSSDFASAFTAFSIGDPLGGVTLGCAVPFALDPGYVDSPFEFVGLLFGAEKQVSNNLKLITENWVFTTHDPTVFFSGGLRFIASDLTVGLGFFINDELLQYDGFPIIPWLDFSLSFGR